MPAPKRDISNWIEVSRSEYSWERDALAVLKAGFPSHEPSRAWSNFEFIDRGSISEVDALVVVPRGVFLIEIKSWPGRLTGDAGTWQLARPGAARPTSMDNPLLLADRKCKRLKSLLTRQKAFGRSTGLSVPFIKPLVFLSHPDLDCALDPSGRQGVFGLGVTSLLAHEQRGGLQGILDFLTQISAEELHALGPRRIDRPTSRALAQAVGQAGIRRSQRSRKVGDLKLGGLLDEGEGYQDFEAHHPRFADLPRRVRIYSAGDADPAARDRLVRAAEREYSLANAFQDPGVLSATAFHDHELGPAIVYERFKDEQRLDLYLAERADLLSPDDRLALLRSIAETMSAAHGRRIFHRALSPRSILVVDPASDRPQLKLMNWQTGERASGSSLAATIAGTLHVDELVDEAASPYRAPETFAGTDPDPQLQDVFSLGALAYRLVTDRDPAGSRTELIERLRADGALDIAAVVDGAGEVLRTFIQAATTGNATDRTATVAQFLQDLAEVETAGREEAAAPPAEAASPLLAQSGDLVGDFLLERRLGRGSTATALLVLDNDEREHVLKVATDPGRNERIEDEASVLAQLDHRAIIGSSGEVLHLGGHAALVLEYASEGTLAQDLRTNGVTTLERLEQWGEDLLSAVAYLERVHISHRDIKPENLGIVARGASKQPRLVLMDFSLARAPLRATGVGTPPYLDPFFGEGERRVWDLYGDRYAAAIVLHEMATGSTPRWGDGRSDPRLIDDEVTIDRDAMPRDLAGPLGDLLAKALRREASERFDTADEMLAAWKQAFATLATQASELSPEAADALLDAATHATPVAALGLSPQALSALDRLAAQTETVADLLSLPPLAINTLTGVSVPTRKALVRAQRRLRDRLGGTVEAVQRPTEPGDLDLATIARRLVPTRSSRNAVQVDALLRFLGLHDATDLSAASPWPSQTEVADSMTVTRGRIGQLITEARAKWVADPELGRVRDLLVLELDRLGGAAHAIELERALAAGAAMARAEHVRAVARAAVESELVDDDARFAQRRTRDGRVLLCGASIDPPARSGALEAIVRLGDAADGFVDADPLAGSTEIAAKLRKIASGTALATFTQERLLGLAAAASRRAVASPRLDLYPRELSAERALRLGRSALQSGEELTEQQVRERIAARFREAAPLPPRPVLDALLRDAAINLEWSDPAQRYVVAGQAGETLLTRNLSSLSRRATVTNTIAAPTAPLTPEVREAREVERRLLAARDEGGLLALMCLRDRVGEARRELLRFTASQRKLDALLIEQMRAVAAQAGADWQAVVRADRMPPQSPEWGALMRLVDQAIPATRAALLGEAGTVVVEHLGLLARYGRMGFISEIGRALTHESHPLTGCWLLVPGDDQSERPVVGTVPVPVLTTNEYLRLPESWLRNEHRAGGAREEAA